MASSNETVPENDSSPQSKNKNKVPEWILARQGINLVVNNNSADAQKLFLQYPDSLVMFAGYTFAVFMDALMSLEEDKIAVATSALKETEKRCATESGWLKQVLPKLFGTSESSTPPKSLAEQLETQIILADSQVCIAILIFLQQDISGFLKGSWVLRKAWKVYQKVYKDISAMYKQQIGELHLPAPLNASFCSSSSTPENQNHNPLEWDVPESNINGYIPSSSSKIPHSKSAILHTTSNSPDFVCPNSSNGSSSDEGAANSRHLFKKSTSIHSGLTSHHSKESFWSSKFNRFHNSLSLYSFPTSLNLFSSQDTIKNQTIDNSTIKRLMEAVSFGYGLFQLGISVLPPSLLRISNILGFGANRENGIACLMYARHGVDMRAPLATLALLWYHTIVRPFYAIDGSNVQAGVDAASMLIKESEVEFEKSALFLFFSGRVSRLNSDIKSALKSFQNAVENASQREIKLLALHEVGWCHLIELDYCAGENVFTYLHNSSRWSRCFYAYLAAICAGANDDIPESDNAASSFGACQISSNGGLFPELLNAIKSMPKGAPLEEFLTRRTKYCPQNLDEARKKRPIFWRLLVFEILYLWNSLPSCDRGNINKIISECSAIVDLQQDEPMKGLSKLILGYAYYIDGQCELGIESFRKCLEMRKNLPSNADDAHISAFTHYELGSLLLKRNETKEEGRVLLRQVNQFTKYDFEHKLSVRVYSVLKSSC